MNITSLLKKSWNFITVLGTITLGTAVVGNCRAQVSISPPNYTVTTPGAQFEFDVNNQSSGLPPQFANVDNSFNFSLPPPPATIIDTLVSTNVTLTYTGGTNTVPLIPQFSSNVVAGVWSPVANYTNTFGATSSNAFSGTNTIVFGRLDAICGPSVFLRISQTSTN